MELAQGTVRQLPQFGFVWFQLTAHLRQSVDQPGAAAGVVDAKKVRFLKGEVVHIKAPFPRSFGALSFCVPP